MIEAKINHVENSMTSQSCCKPFVEALEAQAFLLNDLSCISKSGWLLVREKPNKRHHRWDHGTQQITTLKCFHATIMRNCFLKHEKSCLYLCLKIRTLFPTLKKPRPLCIATVFVKIVDKENNTFCAVSKTNVMQ